MKITKSKKWYVGAYIITTALAWFLCIVPTLAVGLLKLPVIATKSAESTLTGSFTVVLVCCAYPLYKAVVKVFKSPSAPVIMWVLFALTYALYKLAQETLAAMVAIFLTAAICNTIGTGLFLLAKMFKAKWAFYGQIDLAKTQEG